MEERKGWEGDRSWMRERSVWDSEGERHGGIKKGQKEEKCPSSNPVREEIRSVVWVLSLWGDFLPWSLKNFTTCYRFPLIESPRPVTISLFFISRCCRANPLLLSAEKLLFLTCQTKILGWNDYLLLVEGDLERLNGELVLVLWC